MSEKLPNKILVVDNDLGVLNSLSKGLESYKINVIPAKNWETALYQYNQQKLDLCLVSLELEELAGTALIQKWRNHEIQSKRHVAMILSTAQQRRATDTALVKELGEIALITKPIKIPNLLSLMVNAMKMSKSRESIYEIHNKVVLPLLNKNRIDKCLAIAQEKLEPLGSKGKFLSAQVHGEAGKVDYSLDILKNLIEKDSLNMMYHNEIAKIYLKSGQFEKAKKSYELADQAAPQNIDRLNEMARMYLKLKMPEQSIEKFTGILSLTPEQQDIKYDMYDEITKAGFLEHAQEFCKQTSTPKELVRFFNNKGVMHSKTSNYNEAIDEYQKATHLIPGSKELYRVLYNMALAHINLKTKPNLEKAHELLLESLKLQGNFEKAREKLEMISKFINKNNS